MASKWFDATFLPSLYGQAGSAGGGCIHITQKQLDVCARYMTITPHGYKPYQWDGRAVTLVAGKVGGYISFGFTAAEAAAWEKSTARASLEKDAKSWARQRTKRPDRYAAELARLHAELDDCIADAAESDDPDWRQEMQRRAAEIAERIALYESTAA